MNIDSAVIFLGVIVALGVTLWGLVTRYRSPVVGVIAVGFASGRGDDVTHGVDGRGWRSTEQLTTFSHVPFAMMIRIPAKPPSLRVSLRQNVQAPATHEFSARHADRDRLIAATRLVADSRQNRHKAVFVRNQTPIRDWATREITSQILRHLLGLTVFVWRRFDVRDPRDVFQRCEPVIKRRRVTQKLPVTVQLEFSAISG